MTSQAKTQITSTLQNLLPSYAGTDGATALPPPLITLTHSLLQRSRARVPRLKAEEEVARCWVVAEIACHRLKTRLNLPRIESRPPCPPKLYKKVYAYLEGVLKDEGRAGRDVGDVRRLPERSVAVSTPKQNGVAGGGGRVVEKVQTASAERGVKRQRANSLVEDDKKAEAASDPSDDPSDGSDEEEQFVDAGEYMEEDGENAGDEEPETSDKKSAPLARGSVMESRFDWLSEERRKDFTQWKAGILRQIDEMEQTAKKPRTQQKQRAIK